MQSASSARLPRRARCGKHGAVRRLYSRSRRPPAKRIADRQPQRQQGRRLQQGDQGHAARPGGGAGEHGRQHRPRRGEILRPEDHEQQRHQQQGVAPAQEPPEAALPEPLRAQRPLQAGKEAVAQPPDHKGPVGAVPDAGAEEDQQAVCRRAQPPLPVPAQGDVEILPEPGGQRHMPAPPEVPQGEGGVGVAEVFRDGEAEHLPQADGHVAVGAEIVVDLQRVADRAQPGQTPVPRPAGEYRVGDPAHRVGDQQLLAKAPDEAAQPLLRGEEIRLPRLDLGGEVVIFHDGAGDELGEEGQI